MLSHKNQSYIVTISSVSGLLSPGNRTSYASSKAAVSALMDSLAVELANTNVKIKIIYPGYVQTNLS